MPQKTTLAGIIGGIAGIAAVLAQASGLPPVVTSIAGAIVAVAMALGFYHAADAKP